MAGGGGAYIDVENSFRGREERTEKTRKKDPACPGHNHTLPAPGFTSPQRKRGPPKGGQNTFFATNHNKGGAP